MLSSTVVSPKNLSCTHICTIYKKLKNLFIKTQKQKNTKSKNIAVGFSMTSILSLPAIIILLYRFFGDKNKGNKGTTPPNIPCNKQKKQPNKKREKKTEANKNRQKYIKELKVITKLTKEIQTRIESCPSPAPREGFILAEYVKDLGLIESNTVKILKNIEKIETKIETLSVTKIHNFMVKIRNQFNKVRQQCFEFGKKYTIKESYKKIKSSNNIYQNVVNKIAEKKIKSKTALPYI